MGHQADGVALAPQVGPDAALDGVLRGVAQAGELVVHVLLDLFGIAAGAVDGQELFQLLHHIITVLLLHKMTSFKMGFAISYSSTSPGGNQERKRGLCPLRGLAPGEKT